MLGDVRHCLEGTCGLGGKSHVSVVVVGKDEYTVVLYAVWQRQVDGAE